MKSLLLSVFTGVLCCSALNVSAQTSEKPINLEVTKTIKASEVATDFELPITCDQAGNIYLKSENDGVPEVRKITTMGVHTATFSDASCPNIKVQFSIGLFVSSDERLYEVVYPTEGRYRYVLIFNRDGSCRSQVKLDTPFLFVPYQMVAFPSGTMLVAGLRWSADREVKAMWPFTALFSSNGSMVKELVLPDDVAIHKLGAEGDPRVTRPTNPSSNSAVARGGMRLASDGNAYLLRRLSPAIVYSISPDGSVVRRFTVDPSDPDFMPSSMQITGDRLAVLFRNARSNRTLLKVVDLQGHDIAEYVDSMAGGKPQLGMAFACYSSPPDRFTFLGTLDDNRVALKTAEPRK
ncbi:MAG: hypothetical protein ABSD63_17780 [Candidatus Korobacteraceae bacterium]|jgi:hypothetical protein